MSMSIWDTLREEKVYLSDHKSTQPLQSHPQLILLQYNQLDPVRSLHKLKFKICQIKLCSCQPQNHYTIHFYK